MTAAARALLSPGGPLALVGGILAVEAGEPDLGGVIRRLAADAAGAPANQILLVPSAAGPALVLDVTTLLDEPGDDREGRVVIAARARPTPPSEVEAVLLASFNLTAAEAAVAMLLARGASRGAIAAARGVALGTIKAQIRSVYQKVGVTREAELAACLAPLF